MPAVPKRNLNQYFKKKEDEHYEKADYQKVNDAWNHLFALPEECEHLLKPKETEEDAQQEEEANSENAELQDQIAIKWEKELKLDKFIDNEAGADGDLDFDESIDYTDKF